MKGVCAFFGVGCETVCAHAKKTSCYFLHCHGNRAPLLSNHHSLPFFIHTSLYYT
ncbi:hypothetical protein BDC45DRAFT_502756 [Circinella umbellata]|nr:hypothetical protein BDC45DRAFT_502756 [Circinella umbellata]